MNQSSIFSKTFWLLCLSHGLFAASFNMILPELPAYLTSLGGGEHKGLIIALFTLTAGLSRPFSGKLADTIGRLPVMYIGVFACMICSAAYPMLAFVNGFLVLRLLHGFSTGFKPTGTAAYVADIVPDDRRGEAMGWLGISLSIGASASPPLGSFLVKCFSTDVMFYTSSALSVLSMVILWQMPETLPARQKFHPKLLKINRSDIYDPAVLPAAWVMIFCYVSYGVILTLVPDLSDALGLPNRGVFFTLFTLASVSTRLAAGRWSDRVGREPVLVVSSLVIALAMAIFARASSPTWLYAGSVVFGLGNGIFSPAINAWSVDLGGRDTKGRSLATMYIALEIAIGGGAALAGWIYGNELGRMPAVFCFAGVFSLLGFVYLRVREKL